MKYVQGMQHRCDYIDRWETPARIIGMSDATWSLYDADGREPTLFMVFFCPFCGEKLPEIEVVL